MFLRDFYCAVCGHVLPDVCANVQTLTDTLECRKCNALTPHVAMCNGGVGYRFRDSDLPEDPRFYRGQVEVEPVTATVEGKPVEYARGGGAIHDGSYFSGDVRKERQERRYWESDKKGGHTPQYFDQRKA